MKISQKLTFLSLALTSAASDRAAKDSISTRIYKVCDLSMVKCLYYLIDDLNIQMP